jgi:hypothetical protein
MKDAFFVFYVGCRTQTGGDKTGKEHKLVREVSSE